MINVASPPGGRSRPLQGRDFFYALLNNSHLCNMKMLLILLFPISTFSQRATLYTFTDRAGGDFLTTGFDFQSLPQYNSAYKNHYDSTGHYLVTYLYDWRASSVPATMNGQPHYSATIQVYRLLLCKCFARTYDTVALGKSFPGTYVANGCFEDVPAEWVKKAKAQK